MAAARDTPSPAYGVNTAMRIEPNTENKKARRSELFCY
jgi:hypothetical protein